MEVCIDVHHSINDFESFIFLTGDEDFKPRYRMLIKMGKQVIIVYASGHLGKEVWEVEKGLFTIQLKHFLPVFP
jgi:uncharacterized LabA/DUF88 family protein